MKPVRFPYRMLNRILQPRPILFSAVSGGSLDGAKEREVERHREHVEDWRAARLASLALPNSWLTLVGLHWLDEDVSTCGSDSDADVPLPDSVPARVGEFVKDGAKIFFVAADDVDVTTKDGVAVDRIEMITDAGDATVLHVGSVHFFLIERGDRVGVRAKDSESEVRRNFPGIDTFPVDFAWRLDGRFEAYDPPKKISVPDILGTMNELDCPGAIVFSIDGKEYRLDIMPSDYGMHFLVFADLTNRKTTYGGGRFLYVPYADEGGRVVVDFNKAFNPPCVFTPWATCPLPMPQNRLPIEISVGEKVYGGHHD